MTIRSFGLRASCLTLLAVLATGCTSAAHEQNLVESPEPTKAAEARSLVKLISGQQSEAEASADDERALTLLEVPGPAGDPLWREAKLIVSMQGIADGSSMSDITHDGTILGVRVVCEGAGDYTLDVTNPVSGTVSLTHSCLADKERTTSDVLELGELHDLEFAFHSDSKIRVGVGIYSLDPTK